MAAAFVRRPVPSLSGGDQRRMTDQPHRAVLLFGAPGVGKGTQGKALGCIPGFFHFSMGDAFRSLDSDSELGQTVRSYTSRGELVPDEVTIQLWKLTLDRLVADGAYQPGADLLVLDGIPRSVRQVQLLKPHVDVLRVIHLTCSDERTKEQLIERLRKRALRENRSDDAKDEVIKRRFQVYRAETQPVVEEYGPDVVVEFDPLGTPAEVLQRILAVVAPIQRDLEQQPASTA